MSISRRTFLAQLAGAFGAASMPDLRKRIEDRGRPFLLPSPTPQHTLHVYHGGYLTFGPETLREPDRPTWREVLRAEGVNVDDAVALAAEMRGRSLTWRELDAPVSDRCWPMVFDMTWNPAARAASYLRRLDIGPRFTTGRGCAGSLEFHEGDNHPGSNEIWVDVADDLSASLLQARLIELGEKVLVVMETETVRRDDQPAISDPGPVLTQPPAKHPVCKGSATLGRSAGVLPHSWSIQRASVARTRHHQDLRRLRNGPSSNSTPSAIAA